MPRVVSWSEAKQLILDGKIMQVVQAHSLAVTLTLLDGRTHTTVEPQIDEFDGRWFLFGVKPLPRAAISVAVPEQS